MINVFEGHPAVFQFDRHFPSENAFTISIPEKTLVRHNEFKRNLIEALYRETISSGHEAMPTYRIIRRNIRERLSHESNSVLSRLQGVADPVCVRTIFINSS